jgi:hypothetical protein
MVLLASAARAAMPTARPVTARMSVTRAAAPKIGLTRPVLVGQPLVSIYGSKVSLP